MVTVNTSPFTHKAVTVVTNSVLCLFIKFVNWLISWYIFYFWLPLLDCCYYFNYYYYHYVSVVINYNLSWTIVNLFFFDNIFRKQAPLPHFIIAISVNWFYTTDKNRLFLWQKEGGWHHREPYIAYGCLWHLFPFTTEIFSRHGFPND